mmetsp:Transcript_32810/g.38487  ORF Transcript_32810/g.38487 Transcript_32810/m.38487 type:complete len:441 (-) Transcript_32810:1015-2337(-)
MAIYPATMNYAPLANANAFGGNRQSRYRTPSNNGGGSYEMGQAIEFTIPMGQKGSVCDFKNSRMTFTVTNNMAAAANNANDIFFQPRVGTLGLINQIYIRNDAGEQFSNFDGFNVLAPLLQEREVDPNWYASNGNALMACSTAYAGVSIASNSASLIKMIPFTLSGVSHPQFPMDSENAIVIGLKLEDVKTCFVSTNAVANSDVIISNLQFHYDVYDLAPPTIASINSKLVANQYIMSVPDWSHSTKILTANETKLNQTINFSKRKALRLIMVVRPTANISTATSMGLQSKTQASITNIICKLNDKTYQSSTGVDMSTTNMVDAFSEMLIQTPYGGLYDMKTNALTFDRYSVAGTSASTTLATSGCFFYEINFSNRMDTDISVSGEQIGNQNLILDITKTATNASLTFDFFVEYENEYMLSKADYRWRVNDSGQYDSLKA